MPETKEHYIGNERLLKILSGIDGVGNIKKTERLEESSLIPDFQFSFDDKLYVLEYQCSPIYGEYEARHEEYQKHGIIDIWLCGSKKFSYYCDDKYNGIRNFGYHCYYKNPAERRNIPYNPRSTVARFCTGYFDPDSDYMDLRGQVIYKLSKNKCEYPASIYRTELSDIHICRYGLYGNKAFDEFAKDDRRWQSKDSYKSVKQHIRPLALFLEDNGLRNVVVDACHVSGREKTVGTIDLYRTDIDLSLRLKYSVGSFDVYYQSKKRTKNRNYTYQLAETITFDPHKPDDIVRQTIKFLE